MLPHMTMWPRVSQYFNKLTKHFAKEICHYVGYNNALFKFSEFSFAVYYLEIASEIYKGKIKLEQYSVFPP